MKKLKSVSVLLLVACSLFAAPKAKAPAEPVTVELSESNLAENQGTMQNQVFNSDGSVTYDAMMKYGGGGISFNINGKKGINLADYNTIHIEFDYKIGSSYKNTDMVPKFKVVTYGSGATFYKGGLDRAYFSADGLEGSIAFDCDISKVTGKAIKVAVPLNGWKWAEEGASDDDLVTMTIKSITFLP